MATLIKYFEWIAVSGCKLPDFVKTMIDNLSINDHLKAMEIYFKDL